MRDKDYILYNIIKTCKNQTFYAATLFFYNSYNMFYIMIILSYKVYSNKIQRTFYIFSMYCYAKFVEYMKDFLSHFALLWKNDIYFL